jgi:hypothetical protein
VELLRESKTTGIKLVKVPTGQLYVRDDRTIRVQTRVRRYDEIAFDEAVAERYLVEQSR